ncbi:DUF4179 domain-containing protein [Paenibacillus soyae]|uniref:DUF4179 domain-containing protein n=1 Tax=Paenibacillus soyae TaxID=2969249 RepID=A0A9X2MP98_9BACL|nr:DUF4179 domain-containing protein [Paenibacillus soyae]MCR2803925.1 DUF4179 domain-containing protein [Paenibacillus soyae]
MDDSRKRAGAEAGDKKINNEEMELVKDSELRKVVNDLREDSVKVRERSDPLNPDLEQKLEHHIMKGLQDGRRRGIRYRRSRVSFQLGAAAVCMLLLLTAFVRISPAFAAFVKEIPGFSGFVELISYDRSLMSALDNEYMQIVNKSDERNGYKLTVNGVIADHQRIVLLYTVEGPGIRRQDLGAMKHEFKDENGNDLQAGIMSFYAPGEGETEGMVQDYFDILMSSEDQIPQKLHFKLQAGGEWLEVIVPIDHRMFEGLREEIELNQTIEVAGQKVTVKKAVITPLQVLIDFESDQGNTKRLNDFIKLELVDDRGISYKTDTGFGDLDNSITRRFHSSYFQKPKTLTLKAEGILMSDRDMSVVIDTEEETLISRPDDRLRLIDMTKRTDAIDFAFELDQSDDPDDVMRGLMLFHYDGVIRDAKGKEYPIEYGDSARKNFSSFHGGYEKQGTYHYHIPNAEYAQPVTIDIDQYLGYELQDISVKIK